jgi:hypothetical protein
MFWRGYVTIHVTAARDNDVSMAIALRERNGRSAPYSATHLRPDDSHNAE